MLQTAELLSCVLLRRTSHAPDTSKCITLSPRGSAGILLQEFAMLGWFLAGRARPTGAGGVGSGSRQLEDVAPAGSRDLPGVETGCPCQEPHVTRHWEVSAGVNLTHVFLLCSLQGCVCNGIGRCQQCIRVTDKLLHCYILLPIILMSLLMYELYPHCV